MAHRTIRRTATAASLIGMAVLGTAALAPAANAQGTGEDVGPTASLGTAWKIPDLLQPAENTLLVSGPYGSCFQWARIHLDPGGYPGSTTMQPEANSIGLGDCTQDLTVHWKNLDSGQEGSKAWTAKGPGSISGTPHPYDAILGSGSGKVEFSVSADKSGATSETLTVDVPEYHP